MRKEITKIGSHSQIDNLVNSNQQVLVNNNQQVEELFFFWGEWDRDWDKFCTQLLESMMGCI